MASKKKKDKKKQLISSGLVAQNRKARHLYTILDTLEAGLELQGSEVKALRLGHANINEAFVSADKGEMFVKNLYIGENTLGKGLTHQRHEERRTRKLLMHRRQINEFSGSIARKGMTIVPLKLYFNKQGRAKLLVGLAVGKKQHDKRETEKQRDWGRKKARILREFS